MKTKLKGMSKRTLSILLVLLMVVSTVTVGVISTTAAYVDKGDNTVGATVNDDSRVGFDATKDINVKLLGDHWIPVNGGETTEIDISSYNSDTKIYFDLYGTEGVGGAETWFNVGGGINATQDQSYTFGTGGSSGNNQNYITVKDKGKIKIKSSYENGSVKLTISSATGSSAGPVEADYYVAGTLNSWAPTEADKMESSGGTTYTKTYENVAAATYQLKVKTKTGGTDGNWYPGDASTSFSGTAISNGSVTNDGNVKFDAIKPANITVTFDSLSGKITSIVANIAQKSVASSVTLTITPSELKLGNKIRTMTATVTGVDSALTATPVQNITYTFKAGGNVIDTVTKKANETTCTISNIPSGDGTLFTEKTAYPITVEVSTDATYLDNSESKNYLPVSDTETVTFNDGGTYYTSNGVNDPTWTKLTSDALNTIKTNVSNLSANQSFTFAISSEQDYVEGYPLYTISQADNKYCTVTQGTKRISRPTVDDPNAGFTVFTYTVTPLEGIKADTATLYIDLRVSGNKAANKIYAQAKFDKTTGGDSTFNHTTKTVKYYFAKMKEQNKNGTIDGRTDGTMYVHYWNNNIERTDNEGDDRNHGYAQCYPVKSDGTTVGNTSGDNQGTQIYLQANQLPFYTSDGVQFATGYNDAKYNVFDVYVAEIPIWATSVCPNKTDGDVDFDSSSTDIPPSTLITMNPNRIYCFFKYKYNNVDKVRVTGVPLDKKFWENDISSRGSYPNEAGEKTFKANAAKLNRNNDGTYMNSINSQLNTAYYGTTTTGLYFGSIFESKSWNNFNWTANLAMRWNNKQGGGNKNEADWWKKQGKCPYYAGIWDLVGMHLKPVTTASGTTYQLQNYDESSTMPFFDYDWLSESTNRATNVFKSKDFPFVSSEYEGITTYSYDSQVDPNRAITKNNNGNAATENFTNTHTYAKLGSMLGYEPFINYDNTDSGKYSFVNEFNIEFYLTNTGSLKGTNGNHDIQFNFSGDDDVWVFVDGVLVLDLGGDHMPSAGSINFTDKKVYYKTAMESVNNLTKDFIGSANQDDFTTDKNHVMTLNLETILNSGSLTGEEFNFKDGATKHTLQMFYLERGDNESNCSLSFNMPQASGLNIFNEVTATQVNSGLQAAALLSANTDAFRYNVSTKKVTDTEWNNLKQSYTNLLDSRKTPADFTTLDALPQFPSTFDAWRTFTQSFTYGTTSKTTTMKGRLSPSGTGDPAASNVLTTIPTDYTTLAKTTYELSDNYVDTTNHDPIVGRTQELKANGYVPGDFNLLMGQKATFNNKVPANMMVQLYQNKALDEAKFSRVDDLITCNTRMMNDVYDYYTTTYDIYDNQLQYYVKEADSDATSTDHIYASDNSNNANSFYFTNYSTDSGVINPAMTVSYHNDINVGNLKIQKVLGSNETATSEAEFSFKVYFKDIFGFDEDPNGAYADYRKYNEYPIVYHRYSTANDRPVGGTTDDPDPAIPYDTVKGIKLKAGEYAVIMGVPVETQYKVVEAAVPGFTLSMITKWAKYPGFENNSDKGDVLYKSRNPFDSAFDNKQIYYQRITVDSKELIVVPPTSRKLTDDEIAQNSTIDYTHNIPTNIVQNTTQFDPYPVNSIPIRSQTQYNGKYISTSWVQFTNQKEGIQVSFNYYPRVIVDGQPASISNVPDTYTYTIEDIYEKNGDVYKYVEMEGSTIKKVKYDEMIKAALFNFDTYNGGVFRNVIDDYQVFRSQEQAETAFGISGDEIVNPTLTNPSMTNAPNYRAFTAQNIKYHTNHFSQPIYNNSTVSTANKSDLWVSYFKDRKVLTDANYIDAENAATSIDDKAAVKKINVWLYNYPRKYTVRYASAQASDNAANFNTSETYNGYYVCNKFSEAAPFEFYYNQRFGGQAVDEEGNPVVENLHFLGPNEYNYPSYTGAEVVTEPEVTLDGQKYKFLYWAFDPYGYNKASDDIRFYYRVATSYNLYPVYGTEEQYNTFKGTPGLSVSLNGDDSFFDVSGRARRRVNILMSPYNCPNDDKNIYSTSVIYVTIGDDVKAVCQDGGKFDEKMVNEFYQKYKPQLENLITGNTVGTALAPFDYQSQTFVLTTKGFKHDVNKDYGTYSPIALTNKNRAQFSTKFTVSPTTSNPDGLKDCFAIAATMLYHNEETGENKWIASDNTVVYDFNNSLV